MIKDLIVMMVLVGGVLLSGVQAKDISPQYKLRASGMVYDILVDDGRLFAATDAGKVDIFDIAEKKLDRSIELPGIKDFMGDVIAPKVYSIDVLKGRMLMVSTGEAGYNNVYLYDGKRLRQLIGLSDKLTLKEARFIDEDTILLGLLSNELILYKISSAKHLYKVQISPSHFNDMALSEARDKVATADESGDTHIVNVADGKVEKLLTGQNVDNVYKLDYKNGVVITAGQDRRCAVYAPARPAYHLSGTFLLYAAGLSPSGKIGVFATNMENDIQVFNIRTRSKLSMLKGHNATLTAFAFIDESELFSSAEEKDILFWKLK